MHVDIGEVLDCVTPQIITMKVLKHAVKLYFSLNINYNKCSQPAVCSAEGTSPLRSQLAKSLPKIAIVIS